MLNLDIVSQNNNPDKTPFDILENNNLCLFSFSNLKSRGKLRLVDCNTFNFDFSKNEQINPKNKGFNKYNEEENLRYIKNINFDIPSLLEESKNKVLNNFEESFVKFCGLNKKQYNEIYLNNNKFNPLIDEFGDINICIKGILDIIKTYSESKKLKIKRNRIKKKAKNKNKNLFDIIQATNLDNEDKKMSNERKEKNDILLSNDNSLSIENKDEEQNLSDNKIKNKTLFNIKKNLKNIKIPGNESILSSKDKQSVLSNSFFPNQKNLDPGYNNINTNNFLYDNNYNLFDNKNTISSGTIKNFQLFNGPNILSNQTIKSQNNFFNFSSNNFDNNSNKIEISGKLANTPNNININNNNNVFTLNNSQFLNTPINQLMYSPLNVNNEQNILTPNSSILSPIINVTTPINGYNLYNDCFKFNYANTSSFLFENNNEEHNKNDKNNKQS